MIFKYIYRIYLIKNSEYIYRIYLIKNSEYIYRIKQLIINPE